MVLLWIPSDGPTSSFGSSLDDDGDAEFAKEHWRLRTMSRASSSEIYDMAWSPNSEALVIGGTDFVARIISANDGKFRLPSFKQFAVCSPRLSENRHCATRDIGA